MPTNLKKKEEEIAAPKPTRVELEIQKVRLSTTALCVLELHLLIVILHCIIPDMHETELGVISVFEHDRLRSFSQRRTPDQMPSR